MQEIKLQQDLQRYAAQFSESITDALLELERSPRRDVSDEALRRNLMYASSAIDIATGPFPEVNLLDMLVFIGLSRRVVDRYWTPLVFGAGTGSRITETFAAAERDLWTIADEALDESKKADVTSLIDEWLKEHPDQVRVEGVRLRDFSALAQDAASANRARRAGGVLSSVRAANASADQALLLAERALFLAHRMPFLLRLQTRVAAREICSDTIDRLLLGEDAPPRVAAREIAAYLAELPHRCVEGLAQGGRRLLDRSRGRATESGF